MQSGRKQRQSFEDIFRAKDFLERKIYQIKTNQEGRIRNTGNRKMELQALILSILLLSIVSGVEPSEFYIHLGIYTIFLCVLCAK